MDCAAAPYYGLIPKDFYRNLGYRSGVVRLCASSPSLAEETWAMCSRDLLFFCNTFGYIYEPRTSKVLPFITYPFQDQALLDMDSALGRTDIGIEKTRDMGGSWMCLYLFAWRFLFRDRQAFMCISRKEDLVDKTEDPDTLMWKIDFILEHLPKWMQPERNRAKLHIKNVENGSVIDGASTTGDVSRGGRRLAELLDEFASFGVEDGYNALAATQAVTNTRIFLSTPRGAFGAHYDVMHAHDTDMRKIRLHWSEHPLKSAGLYTSKHGRLKKLDKTFKHPKKYPFRLDDKLRSPWYDREKRRGLPDALFAQEFDIDYVGAGAAFFDSSVIDRILSNDCLPPTQIGDIRFDPRRLTDAEFHASNAGPLRLWLNLDVAGCPPRDRRYCLGVDIATGTGASNSSISIGDRKTMEKVAEYTNPHVMPHELGRIAVALCRWFCGPDRIGGYLIWEANGPGRIFGRTVIESGYREMFYRTNEKKLGVKPTNEPGWYATKDTKLELFGDYRKALSTGLFINHSRESIIDCRSYVYAKNGGVVHAGAASSTDPSGARDNHGDRVTADAIMWRGMKAVPKVDMAVQEVPEGCFAHRRQQRELARTEGQYW